MNIAKTSPKDGRAYRTVKQVCDSVVCPTDFPQKDELLIKWFVSVQNVLQKRSNSRIVLVLQGKQGIGKTTFLHRLVGRADFWEGGSLSHAIKYPKHLGVVIFEIAEIDVSEKKAIEQINLFLKLKKVKDRRASFAITTNEEPIFKKSNNIFIIPVKEFKDISKIDMNKFWAEIRKMGEA